ncbi:MAG: polysaccharide export protein [Gammaproteobacteria bacterium]|nr:polysaccharide export protein [Gammaproteobacteria bacterium]
MPCQIAVTARLWALIAVLFCAASAAADAPSGDYQIRPGDVLQVVAWKEPDLNLEILVRPDGKFSFPLAGEILAVGRSPDQVRAELVTKIASFVPDVVVTVVVKAITGNKAFVLGKVNQPGAILMTAPTTVMQALAVAGGAAQFAHLKNSLVLRGQGTNQTAIPFNYNAVEAGLALEQNIVLQAGDVIVVP